MTSADVRADRIVAGLSALGLDPRVEDHDDHARIELEVSGSATAELWRALIALLEAADRFGLVSTVRTGLIAWAAVRKDSPATGATPDSGGTCHQL